MQTPDELGISGPLRAALAFAGAAVLYAGLVLLIAPADSARLFAWDIQPPVTASFMGAFYMTAIPMLFVFARRGTPWRQVRPVLPTLFILSATMLIATALHLDRFLWSNAVAWAWAGLYLLYPPLTALLYIQHARRAPGPESVVVPVMRGVRPLAFATALAFAGLRTRSACRADENGVVLALDAYAAHRPGGRRVAPVSQRRPGRDGS